MSEFTFSNVVKSGGLVPWAITNPTVKEKIKGAARNGALGLLPWAVTNQDKVQNIAKNYVNNHPLIQFYNWATGN